MLNWPSRRPHQPKRNELLPGPALPGYQVEHNDACHLFVINHLIVRCTAIEYQVLMFLLLHYAQPVTCEELITLFDDLVLDTPDLQERAKRKVVKVASDLRVKIWPCGLILTGITGVGYTLSGQPESALSLPTGELSFIKETSQVVDRL